MLTALLVALAQPALSAPLKLIAFGDSLTQGYGLPEAQGLVPQLQDWLGAHGQDVTVENAGVSGDTSAGGASRIGWTLAGGGDAIIVELGGNDLLRGIPPETTRANLDAVMKAASDKGLPILLIGLPAPANYGPDYQKQFDAIYPALAAKYQAMLIPDYFAPLRAKTDRTQAMAAYMQPDGIHPNAEGVKVIVASLGPKVMALLKQVHQSAGN
ncbi:MAG: arylesterase [Paracoccaceae bacterium]|nr:arylesterase [Paracoccaceae bacterium]